MPKLPKGSFKSNQGQVLKPGEWEIIETRFFEEEDFEDVPNWVQAQIHKICNRGLGETPEELTHEINGRTFIYRLDFDGPKGEILGVSRKLRDKSNVEGKSKNNRSIQQPQWEVIGRKSLGKSNMSKVPVWVQKRID